MRSGCAPLSGCTLNLGSYTPAPCMISVTLVTSFAVKRSPWRRSPSGRSYFGPAPKSDVVVVAASEWPAGAERGSEVAKGSETVCWFDERKYSSKRFLTPRYLLSYASFKRQLSGVGVPAEAGFSRGLGLTRRLKAGLQRGVTPTPPATRPRRNRAQGSSPTSSPPGRTKPLPTTMLRRRTMTRWPPLDPARPATQNPSMRDR